MAGTVAESAPRGSRLRSLRSSPLSRCAGAAVAVIARVVMPTKGQPKVSLIVEAKSGFSECYAFRLGRL